MGDTIITVSNLGKSYRLSHQGDRQRYTALRDVISEKVRNLFHRRPPTVDGRPLPADGGPTVEDFWALRNVSFDVKRGEVLGIIGRNGAGKSTLLKILSRITEPTEGRIHLKGRVASLLEVGTGFHPELTGRENIFLNGAILGMNRVEIKKKFDEIVAFSEVEKFLDTPVKRFSSGMYMRLAFAVAAHLEPDILIVDEVLAVGDATFQKKCLGKMHNVALGGRTVLYVSHNLQTVRQMCQRVLLLQSGRLVAAGNPHDITGLYMGHGAGGGAGAIDLVTYPRAHRPEFARLLRLEFQDSTGQPVQQMSRHEEVTVIVHFVLDRTLEAMDIAMAVVHVEGQRVFSESYSDKYGRQNLPPGNYVVRFTMPLRFLKLESYFLVVGVFNAGRQCDLVESLPLPALVDENMNPDIETHRWGIVRIPVAWSPVTPAGASQPQAVAL